jgi:methyl-galactoside transport system substrate-binding protein
MRKLLIVLCLLMASGCTATKTVVPLFIYNVEDEYMADFEARIKTEIGQRFLVKTYDGQNSQIIQNDNINQMLEDKVPLMIINPVDRLSVYSIIEKAKLKGTKIIFFNREPLAQDMALSDSVYYVGADAIESAQLQAQIIMTLFGNDPLHLNEDDKNGDGIIQAVILKGELGHQDAEARTKYVIDTLHAANYKVEVLEVSIANFDQNQGRLAMDRLLDVYGDRIEVVISNNDAMALGAITSLNDKGYFVDSNKDGFIDRTKEKWMPVVGIDGLDVALKKIEEGYLFGTVFNDSQNMAEAIVELSQFLLEGKDLSQMKYSITDGKYIWINYKKITLKEN